MATSLESVTRARPPASGLGGGGGAEEGPASYEPLLAAAAPTAPPPRPGELSPPLTLTEQQSLSLRVGGVNLAKAMLGVGLLALPRTTVILGVGTTLIFLAALAALTFLSLHFCTVASARTGLISFSDVVREHTGLAGQTLLEASVIANGAGILIIALIVVGDILVSTPASQGLLSPACGDRATVLGVVTLVVLAPLVSVTRFQGLAGTSALGVAAILGWSGLTAALFAIAGANGQLHAMAWWPRGRLVGHGFESATQVVATLPVLLVAYVCQMSLAGVLRDLQYVRGGQIDRVAAPALGVAFTAYAALGVFSYGVFGAGDIHSDALQSFTVEALSALLPGRLAQAAFVAVRLGFLVSLLGTFPLQMGPLRDALWQLLFRQELRGPGLWLVTYWILAGVYTGAAWIRDIWTPLVLIGSTAGVSIALIFPGLLAIRTEEALTEAPSAARARQAGGVMLVVVGLAMGVFGVIRVIAYKDPFEED